MPITFFLLMLKALNLGYWVYLYSSLSAVRAEYFLQASFNINKNYNLITILRCGNPKNIKKALV